VCTEEEDILKEKKHKLDKNQSRRREDPLHYISLSCEISAPPFILIAILIFLFNKWMVEISLEGIQSHQGVSYECHESVRHPTMTN
jgi:hypothetical protein